MKYEEEREEGRGGERRGMKGRGTRCEEVKVKDEGERDGWRDERGEGQGIKGRGTRERGERGTRDEEERDEG